MWPSARLTALLGIELPLIQAPMAGCDTPALAAAVATAGGLGSLGLAFLDPGEVARRTAAARAATNGALNFNFLMVPPAAASVEAWRCATDALAFAYAEREVAPPPLPGPAPATDEAAIVAALAAGPQVMSFHLGLPSPALLARIRAAGVRVLATATAPAEARALEAAGCDAVIAQGWEAGGHRGTHLDPGGPVSGTGEATLFGLVPAIRDAVSVPVIAAGGIADGRGVAAAFMLGADGVQMGTAFLRCPESGASPAHRQALAAAGPNDTETTRAFSGRPARSIRNRLSAALRGRDEAVAPYPLQFGVIGPLIADDADFQPLWAGQGVGLASERPAAEVLRSIADQALRLLG